MRHTRLLFFCLIGMLLLTTSERARTQEAKPEAPPESASEANPLAALSWQSGPVEGKLGDLATIKVGEGFAFLGQPDAGKFMELMQNPTDGSELGLLLSPDESWFVVFEFSDDGYVKDDERDLDADALLKSIREGTEAANKERTERGWETIEVVGWQRAPFYDPATRNLTWAIHGRSGGSDSVNYSTRMLGRRGVMRVNLVVDRDGIDAALPAFTEAMNGFAYNPGQRYSEFTTGDKVAEYGLTGLIVGGTGVALLKSGLLERFWKLIVLGVVALGGWVKRFFSRTPAAATESSDTSTHV